MISRTRHLELLKRQFVNFPGVAILGARQVGKTTLARQLENDWNGPKRHFDLEDPDDQARWAAPAFVLRELKGLVVLGARLLSRLNRSAAELARVEMD